MTIDQKKVKNLFDYRDGVLYWKNSRRGVKANHPAGTPKKEGYIRIKIDGKAYYSHRLIYVYHYGNYDGLIDHINGDVSDNRIENLRACTHAENLHNYSSTSRNSIGAKNVCWDKVRSAWEVSVVSNGVRAREYTDVLIDAVAIAFRLRNSMHGEFANHG